MDGREQATFRGEVRAARRARSVHGVHGVVRCTLKSVVLRGRVPPGKLEGGRSPFFLFRLVFVAKHESKISEENLKKSTDQSESAVLSGFAHEVKPHSLLMVGSRNEVSCAVDSSR